MIGGVLGTPKDLKEATEHALQHRKGITCEELKHIMRDYMAQKFAVAMMKHKDEAAQEALKDVWKRLTGEDV